MMFGRIALGLDFHRRVVSLLIIAVHLVLLYHQANAQPPQDAPPANSCGGCSPVNRSRAVVIVVLVCVFFLIGFLSVYIRLWFSASRAGAPTNWSRRTGLDPVVIERLPVFAYSEVKDLKIGKGSLECAICLAEFREDDESLRLLPRCSHVFHADCIDAWLYSHVTCPVCRARLSPDSSFEVSDPENPTVNQTADQIAIDDDGRQQRTAISGKFPRSNSTGHSLGLSTERYTLRLPDDVRKRIMAQKTNGRLKRTKSYDAVLWTGEGSSRRGCRSGGDGSSRGRHLSMTVPFVSRIAAVKLS